MSCPTCEGYLGDWRSHGPSFPEKDWEVLQSEEIEVGTHGAATVMQGTARCRACGQVADFGCSYGPGYHFTARSR